MVLVFTNLIRCYKNQIREAGYNVREIEFSYPQPSLEPPQYLFIQMDYCEDTLLGLIESAQIFHIPHENWRIFIQIVEGLAYIHSQGIVHRDVIANKSLSSFSKMKPGNIFLDEKRNVKIGDFGLATEIVPNPKYSENLAPQSSVVGTATYSSPEGGRGDKSDIYSLGIIFFEVFTGTGHKLEGCQLDGFKAGRLEGRRVSGSVNKVLDGVPVQDKDGKISCYP
jgi:translation initiation factor 2-alpha kinase 4